MKIAKLSLVAAVAVAGFTTANAQPLEEAIKNVDVSVSVVYRYNDYQDDKAVSGAASSSGQKYDRSNNNYKIGLNVSSKVNDDVKFNSRFLVASDNGDFATDYDAGANTVLDTSSSGDVNPSTSLSQANFAYTGLKNTTVTVGKQGLATPYTTAVMIDENEQTGTGILALSAIGPVTLGAAYFDQTNLQNTKDSALSRVFDGTENISAVAAIATFAPVTIDTWYLDVQDKFDTYTVGAKSDLTLGGVALGADARWASLTPKASLAKALGKDDANTIEKIALTAKAGIVNGKLAYAATSKDGGITGLDSDAVTVLKGWNLNTLGKTDADYWQAVVGVDILSNLNLSANYGDLKYTGSTEEEELYGQLTYKMSKNLSTYVRYGTYSKEVKSVKSVDATTGRLQVAYTF